ncbi:PilW family protein [Ralstonia sp. UBA689]|uniref:PilW family protein n=1 Tax=Ralstonia sp. UBA689 TaxID=1947373 RepID=UPI0025ED350C|nr:PilW family protein [Ralstonia sp. UBA689]
MRRLPHSPRGATLVELLIGTVIGLIVIGIALQLTLVARARYQRIADEALIEDRGTQALALLTTAIQQAGWITDTPASQRVRQWTDLEAPPSIQGADNCRARNLTPTRIDCQERGAVRGSDALAVRFAGKGSPTDNSRAGDHIFDCLGNAVPERVPGNSDDPRAGVMLLYITEASADNEPQLMCRSLSRSTGELSKDMPGMVRGIETLQLLYTVGTANGTSTKLLSARSLTSDQWHRVQAVHVALVARGEYSDPIAAGKPTPRLALFPLQPLPEGNITRQDREFTPTKTQRRRAVFTTTVRVRNPLACEVDVC